MTLKRFFTNQRLTIDSRHHKEKTIMGHQGCARCGSHSGGGCCDKKKKPGPNIPPCACAKAFDDNYIRGLMTLIELGVTATGGPAAAAAYAAVFCEDGCVDGNLGELFHVCGKAAILANNLFEQTILATLKFSKLQITRTVNPDCSVEVYIFRNQELTLVSDPTKVLKSFGVTQLVIDPTCCLRSESFIDLRPQCPCPPTPPPV